MLWRGVAYTVRRLWSALGAGKLTSTLFFYYLNTTLSMKPVLVILLLLLPMCITAQNLGMFDTPVDSRGRYNISYIHNFYNRSEEAVKTVAKEYLSKIGLKNITIDTEEHIVASEIQFIFKGRRKDCAKNISITLPVHIYYIYGRTKIEFTNITYSTTEKLCSSEGTLIQLTSCSNCDNYALLLKTIRAKAYYISVEYKKYLRKRALDNDLF